MQQRLPKHIHYVWVGGPLPDEQRAYVDAWRDQNPDYEFTLWNESNIDFSIPLVKQAYDQKKWSKVADIVRLMAVLKHGGIYLDTDFQIYKPLDPLLRHRCFYGFQTEQPSKDWVANGAFGAEPGHWFIARALTRLLSMRSFPGVPDRPTRFGPKLITKLLVEEGLAAYSPGGTQIRDIHLCPTEVFYPYAFGEDFHPSCIKPNTLAVHVWSHQPSWNKDVPAWVRLAKSIRKRVLKTYQKPQMVRGLPTRG